MPFSIHRCDLPTTPREYTQFIRCWAGLLAPGSPYSPYLPTVDRQWFVRLSSPVTAAGPRRIRTVFPIKALQPPTQWPGLYQNVERCQQLRTCERIAEHQP
jgi:hypothetical protein